MHFWNKLTLGLRSVFRTGAISLAGSALLAQVLAVLLSPVLSRLYTPFDFGVLAVFGALLTVPGQLVCLGYNQAIPLPRNEVGAVAVLTVSVASSLLVSLAAGIVVVGFPGLVVKWSNTPSIASFLPLLPLALLGMGLYQSLSYWATRNRLLPQLARTRVTQSLGRSGIQLSAGYMGVGVSGLVAGDVIGQWIGTLTLSRSALRSIKHLKIRARHILWAVFRYRRFPTITVWANLVGILGVQAPVLLLGKYFSSDVVGHYSMATRVLLMPSAIVGQAVSQVVFARLSKGRESTSDSHWLVRVLITLLYVGLPLFGAMYIAGERAFGLVFGEMWATAGTYVSILSPWLFVSFLASPLSSIAIVEEKQGTAFVFTIAQVVLKIVSIIVGGWVGSDFVSLVLFSATGTASACLYLAWLSRLSQMNVRDRMASQLPTLLVIVLLLVGAAVTKAYAHVDTIWIATSFVVVSYTVAVPKLLRIFAVLPENGRNPKGG